MDSRSVSIPPTIRPYRAAASKTPPGSRLAAVSLIVLGTAGFDANGDATQQFVSFLRVDPAAAGGAGDWVLVKHQDFGPPS